MSGSRSSIVGPGWTARGSNPGRVENFFSLINNVHTVSGAHPALSEMCTGVIYRVVNRPRREVNPLTSI